MSTKTIDQQRRRDGAFFEDWSEWRSLGGFPQAHRYPVGKRPTGMPQYHCSLLETCNFMGGPAFEVAIPEQGPVIDRIERIKGARMRPRRLTRSVPVQIWYVPAEEWQALRAVLPAIKAYISAKCGGQH